MFNHAVNDINKRLSDRYGTNLAGQPFFRIVWSNSLYETRIGTFNEFYGPIFLRQYKGAKQVRKYNYIQERWLLEFYRPSKPPQEILDYDHYECIYVFEDNRGNPLPPIWRATELICWCVVNPNLDASQKRQILEDNDRKIFESDVKYFEDVFDITKIQSQFMAREAIILPGKVIQ